jgi:hypothetical protein
MHSLPSTRHESAVRPVSLWMPAVLYPTGAEHPAEQTGGSRDAGSDCPIPAEPWPGAHLGIRRPSIDETPLSIDECWIAVRECLT